MSRNLSIDAAPSLGGFWLIVTATTLMTLRSIFTKLAYLEGAGVDATLLLRFVICLPVLWGVFYFSPKISLHAHRNRYDITLIALLSFLGYYTATKLDFYSVFYLGAGLSRLVIYSYPMFVILFNALYLRKPPQTHHIILALMIQAGLVLAIGGGSREVLVFNWQGGALAIACAIAYAMHLVLLTHKGKHIASGALVTIMLSFSTLYMSIDFLLTNHYSELMLTSRAYFWIAVMAVFTTAFPVIMFVEGVKRIGSNDSSLVSSFAPILGLGLSWLIVDERYNAVQLAGAVLIVIAIYILGRKIGKRQTQPLD